MLKTRIRELIESDGRTQKEIAKVAGVRENVISELANNSRSTINREHIAKIAKVLGIEDMNKLFYIE